MGVARVTVLLVVLFLLVLGVCAWLLAGVAERRDVERERQAELQGRDARANASGCRPTMTGTGEPKPKGPVMSETETDTDTVARLRAELEQAERDAAEAKRREHQQQLDVQVASLPPELQAQAADLEQRLAEQLDQDFPPAWKPTKPAEGHPLEIFGLVERVDLNVGPSPAYGTYSAVMQITTTKGERWSVWAQHGGVIFQQMRRARVQPGDVIGIRYVGTKRSEASGFTYQNYRLAKEGDQALGGRVDYDEPLPVGPGNQQQLPVGNGQADADDDIPF
jgi:hypothetical protein